jgi:hypothetical protein
MGLLLAPPPAFTLCKASATNAVAKKATVMLVPTGVGASIGGYAGDATAALHTIAAASSLCLTHPNVLNAAGLFNKPANALYVEGAALDGVLTGKWVLSPVPTEGQTLGIVWDKGIDPAMQVVHHNTVAAMDTIFGITVPYQATTQAPMALSCELAAGLSATSQGTLRNPQVLYQAVEVLLAKGATAIALCVAFPDALDGDAAAGEHAYMQGLGPDPVGGLEAILSHLIVQRYQVPCAHAPVFSPASSLPEYTQQVDKRVAAECITPTFLPCILQGLVQSPSLKAASLYDPATDLGLADIGTLIVPANTLGGVGTLAAMAAGITIIAIAENTTVCHTPALTPHATLPTYAEAAKWVATQR